MTDTVTVTLQAQGHPDFLYRGQIIITPETITLVYRLDNPTPTPEGIYPIRAEVEGLALSARPTSIGMGFRNRRAAWLYRTHPEHWPAWLIELGAQHRPQHQQ
ncbi:hypothetical protein [Streptomyces anulatus]|uniref:hypothetical protein n=1 Tax=Streptomyces anulatus TaxID=1892 RepID=UPI00331909CE